MESGQGQDAVDPPDEDEERLDEEDANDAEDALFEEVHRKAGTAHKPNKIATFIFKLWSMFTDPSVADICSFSGSAFRFALHFRFKRDTVEKDGCDCLVMRGGTS